MKVSPILLGAVALLVVPRPHLATSQDSQEPQNSQDPQDFEDSGETNEGADEELPVAEALRIGPYWRLPRPPPRAVLVAARRSDSPFRHDFPPRNEGPFRQDLPFPDVPLTDHLYTSSLDNIQHKKLSSHNPGASEVYPPVYRTIAGVSNAYKTRRTTQTPDQVRTIETMTAEESWTILGVPFSGLPRRRRPGQGPPPHHRVQGRVRGRKAPPKVRAPPRVRQNLRRPQPAILAPVHRPLSLPSPQQPPTTPPRHPRQPPTTSPRYPRQPPTTSPRHPRQPPTTSPRYPRQPPTTSPRHPQQPPTTPLPPTTFTPDSLDVYNMAGPPYYDTIPPSVIRGEESATPMSPPTTPPPPPAITPKIRRPVSTPRPRWPYRPPSSVPAFVTTALDDRDPWVTSHSSQESTLSNSPGDFDWFNNWNINWNHDWNGGDWSNKWNSDISSRKDTTSPTSLIVTNSRNSLDVYDDEDEARFDLPQAEGTENSLLADLLLNHKFPRGPATRHRYPERSQTEDEYPETTRTKTRYPETSKANRKYSENPPRMNKYPETGFTENRYPERPPETSTYPERPQRENKFPERPPVNERYPEKPLITDIYSARASAEEQYPETPRQDRYPMRTRHPEVPLKEDTHPATTTTRYLETHLTESGHSGHLKIPAVQVRHLQGPRTKTRHPERLPTKTRHPERLPTKTRHPERLPTKTRHPERLPTKTRHPERLPTKTRYPERLPTKTRHPPLTANERYGPVSLERPLASPRPSRKQQRVPVVTVEQRRGAVATGGERGVPETSVGIHGGSWYTEERKRQPSVAYQSSRTPGESRDTTWDESRPLHRPPPSLRQAAPPRPVLTWQTAREAGGQPRRGG